MRPNHYTSKADSLHHSSRTKKQTLFVLHSDARFTDRLLRATQVEFRLVRLRGWQHLMETFINAPPGAMVLVDPYFGTSEGDGPAERLMDFLRRFPSAVLIAAFWHRYGRHRDVWSLSRCGVAELLYLDEENSESIIRRRLAASRVRPLKEILEGCRLQVKGKGEEILEAASEVVASGGLARDLARKLCLSRQTLLRHCQRASLPPPRELLRWVRALHAAAMLDDPGHTIRSVSRACGYSDDRGLRRLFRGLVDVPPSHLRERGAFRLIQHSFRDAFSRRLAAPEGRRVA